MSGVMAVVAAGLVAGTYGRTKVSPSVQEFMHAFRAENPATVDACARRSAPTDDSEAEAPGRTT